MRSLILLLASAVPGMAALPQSTFEPLPQSTFGPCGISGCDCGCLEGGVCTCGQVAQRDTSACRWVPVGPQHPGQWGLFDGDKQCGVWDRGAQTYWPIVGDKWGKARTTPPVPFQATYGDDEVRNRRYMPRGGFVPAFGGGGGRRGGGC